MFLLPSINLQLRPKILDLKPGTRIVSNTFTMEDWEADETADASRDCTSWCTALFWIVPAKVEGTWQVPGGTLTLTQQFQKVSGTLGSTAIADGKLRGDEISFTVGNAHYTGHVNGTSMKGTLTGGSGGSWYRDQTLSDQQMTPRPTASLFVFGLLLTVRRRVRLARRPIPTGRASADRTAPASSRHAGLPAEFGPRRTCCGRRRCRRATRRRC